MDLLLDTHVFLLWDANDARLPTALGVAVGSPDNRIFVSAVSVWEIAIKKASGKLSFSGSTARAIERQGFQALPISVEHAEWAGQLPQYHRDPFDRLLVAQAQLERLILVSVDERILRYPVQHL